MTTTNTNERQAGTTVAEYWNGRGSLRNLVAELERQKETKIDFVADVRALGFMSTNVIDSDRPGVTGIEPGKPDELRELRLIPHRERAGAVAEFFEDYRGLPLSESAYGQLCEKCDPPIPVGYGRKLLRADIPSAGRLLSTTFADRPKRRLIRCLDGRVRAVLSDSYRFVDHYDLAFTALEVVKEHNGEVIEASLDDHKMRLKFTTRELWDQLDAVREGGPKNNWYAGGLGSQEFLSKVGARTRDDLPGGPGTIHPSVVVSNSETGQGGINVRLGIMQGICFNLATVETVVNDIHLGGKLEAGIFSEEARAAESKSVFLKARDAIRAAFTPDRFRRLVEKLRASAEFPIEAPSSAVRLCAERLDLSDDHRDVLLAHFITDWKPTALGLASAVTRFAQDYQEPEVAEGFETFAGELLSEPKKALAGLSV